MLDLLCRREMPPVGLQIGDARHASKRYETAGIGADAQLALSLEREATISQHVAGYDADANTWPANSKGRLRLARTPRAFAGVIKRG